MTPSNPACHQVRRWPAGIGAIGVRQPVPASFRAAEDSGLFEVEWEVEYEGTVHRFTFEVTARDEDEATDRALVMLERARLTDARQKAA